MLRPQFLAAGNTFYYFYYITRAHDQSGQNVVYVVLNYPGMVEDELGVLYFTKFHPYGH